MNQGTIICEEARLIGMGRQLIHSGHSTPRFFEDPNEEDIIGAAGELEFSKITGLPMDRELKARGDNGIDFVIYIKGRRLTIDVKTARKPFHLLLKKTEATGAADILVLAGLEENKGTITFLGWEHKSLMLLMPLKEFGYGIVNHYRKAEDLRLMTQLYRLIEMRDKED